MKQLLRKKDLKWASSYPAPRPGEPERRSLWWDQGLPGWPRPPIWRDLSVDLVADDPAVVGRIARLARGNKALVFVESRRAAEQVAALLAPGEELDYTESGVRLGMDFVRQGQERFARIYRLLDPERRWTTRLRRTKVAFDDEA